MIKTQQRIKGKIEPGRATPDIDFGTHFSNSVRSFQRNGIMSKSSRSFDYWYQSRNEDGTNVLRPEEANEKYPSSTPYTSPVTETVAKLKYQQYLRDTADASLTEAAHRSSNWNYLATLGGGFVGSMTDPIEASVGMLFGAASGMSRPLLGLHSGIKNPALRTVVRGTTYGVAEGAVVEPLYHLASGYNNEAYSITDSAMNMAFSGLFGGGFAGMRALVGDYDPGAVVLSKQDMVRQVNSIAEYFTMGKRVSEWSPVGKEAVLSTPQAKELIEAKFKKKQEQYPDLSSDQKTVLLKDAEMETYMELKPKVEPSKSINVKKTPDNTPEVEPVRNDNDLDNLNKQQEAEYEDEVNQYIPESERADVEGDGEDIRKQRDVEQPTAEEGLDPVVVEATVNDIVAKEFPSIKPKSILDEDVPQWLKDAGDKERGFVYKGQYYYNPKRLKTPEDIVSNVLHEVVGHIGLRSFFDNPKEFDEYIKYIQRNYDKEIQSWKKEYKVDKSDEAAEEIHAIAADNDIIAPALVRVLYAKAVNKFTKNTQRAPSPYEDVLIRENIYQGFKRVRKQKLESYLNGFIDVRELDDDYAKAVKAGDWDTVSMLVNKAAQAAGYTEGIVYHGSGKEPLSDWRFKKEMLGTRTKAPSSSLGFFFASDKQTAESYIIGNGELFKGTGRYESEWQRNIKEGGQLYSLYLKSDNKKVIIEPTPGERAESYYKRIKQAWDEGYDMVVIKDTSDEYVRYKGEETQRLTDVYVVRDPNQAKMSDLVTYDDKGKMIPLSQRFDITTDDIRFQRDTIDQDYLELAKDPERNKSKLQRMVDEAAKKAGYDSPIVYHGTGKDFNTFTSLRFTGDRDLYKRFVNNNLNDSDPKDLTNKDFYTREPNGYFMFAKTENSAGAFGERIISAKIKYSNPLIIDAKGESWMSIKVPKKFDFYDNIGDVSSIAEYAKENGYDSAIIKNVIEGFSSSGKGYSAGETNVTIAFNSNQIKSADPVTYDDAGNIIPLSQRFQEGQDDIRFQRDTPDITARREELNKGAIMRQAKKLISSTADTATLEEISNNSLVDNIANGNVQKKAQKHNQASRVRIFFDITKSQVSDWAEKLQYRLEEITPTRIKALKTDFVTRYAKDVEAFLEKYNAQAKSLNEAGLMKEYEIAAKYAYYKSIKKTDGVVKPSDIGMEYYNLVAKYNKEMVDMINRSGGAMKYREGYTVKQSHNAEKIAKAAGVKRKRFNRKTMKYYSNDADLEKAFEYWYKDLKKFGLDEDLMDEEGVFDTYKNIDKEHGRPVKKSYLDDYLRDVFLGIWDGQKGDSSGSAPGGIIKKTNAKRNIHFKTGEGAYNYRVKYGIEDTQAAILNEFEEMATNIVLMQDYGSSYRYNIESVIDALTKAAPTGDNVNKNKLKKLKKIAKQDFDIIDGSANDTDHMTLKKVVTSLRILSNVARMGGLFFTSQSDVAFAKYALRRFDIKTDKVNDFFHIYRPKNEAQKVALQNNLAMLEGLEGATSSRLDPDSIDLNSSMAWLQHKFFTVNGMNWWNKHVREGMLLGMMRRLGVASNYSMKQLEEMGGDTADLRALLSKYDIDELEWELYRKQSKYIDRETGQVRAKQEGESDSVYLTHDMVDDIDPEDIRAMLKARGRRSITDNVIKKEREKLRTKLGGFMRAEMDRGVLTPGVREWRILNFGTDQGSWQNLTLKLLTQYKSFPLAMWNKTLVPSIREGKIGALLIYSTMAGMISLMVQQTKDVLTGKQVRPWNDFTVYADAIARSGGLSFAMDLINKDWSESGMEGGFTEFLGGPTLDMAADAMGVTYQTLKGTTDPEEMEKAATKAAKWLKDWTPGANLPIIQQMYRSLVIYNIMNMVDTDTLKRSEAWMKRELGQEYWYGAPTGNDNYLTLEDIFFNTLKQ